MLLMKGWGVDITEVTANTSLAEQFPLSCIFSELLHTIIVTRMKETRTYKL